MYTVTALFFLHIVSSNIHKDVLFYSWW